MTIKKAVGKTAPLQAHNGLEDMLDDQKFLDALIKDPIQALADRGIKADHEQMLVLRNIAESVRIRAKFNQKGGLTTTTQAAALRNIAKVAFRDLGKVAANVCGAGCG